MLVNVTHCLELRIVVSAAPLQSEDRESKRALPTPAHKRDSVKSGFRVLDQLVCISLAFRVATNSDSDLRMDAAFGAVISDDGAVRRSPIEPVSEAVA